MPEIVNGNKIFSLKEVTMSIRRTLSQRYRSSFWVRADINKLNYYPYSGHCYPDLLQKEEGKVVAQMRSMIWSRDYQRINKVFKELTGSDLGDHISVLFLAAVQYDSNHGLSLRILDIDPTFSLGQLEREKLDTISKLKSEGVFTANQLLHLPLLPSRIAVISVESSKGYADFKQLIQTGSKGFNIVHRLFPSLLQGEKAADQMIERLEEIKAKKDAFDAVAIIRGGGGEIGLAAFNDFHLSKKIALFPLPVITGIGHATNLTVVEMVAHTNTITPSALAEMLIEKFEYFKQGLNHAIEVIKRVSESVSPVYDQLNNLTKRFISGMQNRLILQARQQDELFSDLQYAGKQILQKHILLLMNAERKWSEGAGKLTTVATNRLSQSQWRLTAAVRETVRDQQNRLAQLNASVDLLNPENVLKRGYSISLINDKVLKESDQAEEGSLMTTQLFKGSVISKVTHIKRTNSHGRSDKL